MGASTDIHTSDGPAVRVVRREVKGRSSRPTRSTRRAPSPSPFDLSGRVAVVVGGTSGLGRSMALGLAQAGATVIPTGRRAQQIDQVCDELEHLGRSTLRQVTDVTDRSSLARLATQVHTTFDRVDILLNCAGMTFKKPTTDIQPDEWHQLLDTNLTGMLWACQAFYPALQRSGHGRVINIASLASYVAFHQVAAYGMSKAGVKALTQSLGCEWAKDGICVNAIAPGIFVTELNGPLLKGTDRGRELLLRTPMGRFGQSQELIGTAVFLASDAASFITGQTIVVDGGFLASGVNS